MGLLDFLFGGQKGHGPDELARRLGMPLSELRGFRPSYTERRIPKRSGGTRRILQPSGHLKELQRRLLRRVFARLRAHSAATGFERGRSIVANARPHVHKAVVVRMDLRDFFENTAERRVKTYFRAIGWNRKATRLLLRLTTWKGGLPAGAPTSPRLSNLVNFRLDCRLEALGRKLGAAYTRYADDLTFSLEEDDRVSIQVLIRVTKRIVASEGYRLHQRGKLRVLRRHQRQMVTGLVVNEGVSLPRATRRWLRAVEHRQASGRRASLRKEQLQGWKALLEMVQHGSRR